LPEFGSSPNCTTGGVKNRQLIKDDSQQIKNFQLWFEKQKSSDRNTNSKLKTFLLMKNRWYSDKNTLSNLKFSAKENVF